MPDPRLDPIGLHRAYAFLNIKAVDGEQRLITGTATSPTPDRMGDIVEPLGVSFKNPLPLLLYHNSQKPVGWVKFKKPTKDGIDFEAKLPTIDEPGTVRDRIEEAWTSIKTGLLAGVSIGFRSIEEAFNKETFGYHFLKTEVLELSLVAIPAQPDARIDTIKSLDIGLAAPGTSPTVRHPHPSGASDTTRVVKTRPDGPMKKTYPEQIASFTATRATTAARIDAIMEKVADEGVTLDAAQKEEHDRCVAEIKEIDEHLIRLQEVQERTKSTAAPVVADTVEKAAGSRAGQVITVTKQTPPGIEFARYAMCLASAKGNTHQAYEIAKTRYPDERRVQEVIKAAVAAGTTTDANWATALVQYQDFAGDFIEFLRPKTIIGKFGMDGIPALMRVPFNMRVASQTAGGSGYWVGEGKPKPLTKFAFSTVTMQWAKVANIAVLTEEEVRFSSPAAEAKVRDALSAALIERLDIDFVDPAKAAVANVSPASITNGVVATPVTGTTAAFFRADFKSLMAPFITANIDPANAVLIMSTSMALSLSLMLNTLGNPEFPQLSMKGGSILGIPVIVSEYLTALGSPSTQMIVLVNASDVYLADDGQVVIDASREASLEMLDAALQQDATAGTGASLVSLWQSNLLGLKAERFINWKLRRSAAVQYLSPAAYA